MWSRGFGFGLAIPVELPPSQHVDGSCACIGFGYFQSRVLNTDRNSC